MKILVLGGDGFCGWPTALHLSDLAHDVVIVDNLSRRRIDAELGAESLTPIRPIEERLSAWREVSGRKIPFVEADVTDFDTVLDLLRAERPDAVAHFAEQRAAPYSMKSPEHKNYTVRNNVSGTPLPAERDRRGRRGDAPRALGDHGRLRLRTRGASTGARRLP